VTERVIVRAGEYHDSVALMLASRDATGAQGVEEVAAVMATPLNVELLTDGGYDIPADAGPNDLVVALRAESEESADAAEQAIVARLAERGEETSVAEANPRSLRSAARRDPSLNLAFVSVPGRYATYEVAQALDAGLNVMCFSDGMAVEDEARLKRIALDRKLLLLGADCGTAVIDGVALGFANVVEPGPVGLVGASGTGLQQVMCLLDAVGVGVSQAIGVGGRDLSAAVGGAMTKRALELLSASDEVEVIAVVSKPPDRAVAGKLVDAAQGAGKPVVLGLVGLAEDLSAGGDVIMERTLEGTARRIAELAGDTRRIERKEAAGSAAAQQKEAAGSAAAQQKEAAGRTNAAGFIRGLFAGGTLCYEAMSIAARAGCDVRSNIPLAEEWRLGDVNQSSGHTFIDFGEDELTEGRAHPMIDPSLRNERVAREASDPEVGAIVLDVVLGYGAHADPAAELAPLIAAALAKRGGALTVVACVCGTKGDPQGLDGQIERLEAAGALVTRNCAEAARLALKATGSATE
jgi:FdrA protein